VAEAEKCETEPAESGIEPPSTRLDDGCATTGDVTPKAARESCCCGACGEDVRSGRGRESDPGKIVEVGVSGLGVTGPCEGDGWAERGCGDGDVAAGTTGERGSVGPRVALPPSGDRAWPGAMR
jgi:hypothetical protein